MEALIRNKFEEVIEFVDNTMADPDIDIDYFIPGVKTTISNSQESANPYILVTYLVSEYTKPTRKIHLGTTALQSSAREIANQVTFSISEFKSEIDSVEMG